MPNISKRNRLDFLGFLWRIQAFSKGYGESKQFFSFPAVSIADMRSGSGLVSGQAISSAAAGRFHVGGIVLGILVFRKELSRNLGAGPRSFDAARD
jgi:hypothetical protein